MYPASGYGRQSAYYDADILLDGTYQIQSVTLDSSSLDLTNYADNKILRVGLLLVKSAAHGGRYVPLSTADGYLNGAVPTHFMSDAVVLAREEHIQYDYIMGLKRKRVIQAKNRVVPVYHHCHIYDTKIFYNNSDLVQITEAQWQKCQRIVLVPPQIAKFVSTETGTRALYWNLGDEEILTEYNIN